MAKLIKILAASIGSGMVLGFGVRALSDIAARREQPGEAGEPAPELDKRLARLEMRLRRLEEEDTSSAGQNTAELEKRLGTALRRDVERHLESAVDDRIAAMEAKLRSATLSLGEEVRQQVDETLRQETLMAVERGLAGQWAGAFRVLSRTWRRNRPQCMN